MSTRMASTETTQGTFDAEVTVLRTRYLSHDAGWGVVETTDGDGEEIVLVGPVGHLEPRDRAHVLGVWFDDSRYGPQVKVRQATPLAPVDPEAVTLYLGRVKHIGPKRAARLTGRYGAEQALEAIDADPGAAFAAVGLRGNAAREAVESWERLRGTRNLHLLLAPHGLAYLVGRIHESYGDSAHRVVSDQPYELTSVFGVGFAIADRIARGLGCPVHDPERARAGVLHILSETERAGSTCMPLDALLTGLEDLLGARAAPGVIERAAQRGDVVVVGNWIYRRATAELEAELAERVTGLLAGEPSRRLEGPRSDGGDAGEDQLTGEQRAAVDNAFAHRLSVITGGPGTGKTASIRAIATRAGASGARVLLVAPTGRAAIRMSEASGVRAKTVHSALGWVPGEGPVHDDQDPLACDLLIVDESSMANLELLVTLLRAVGPTTHLVLVGDADQLAPVGAGKPFAELVMSDSVPSARLTHIFRQAAGSMIVQGAHAVRRGRLPEFRPSPGMRRDLFLIERPDPAAALTEIVSLVSHRLPEHYGVDPIADIQVFAPVYRGELGIDALNEALREALNPAGRPVRGGRLRVGDKLMMTGRNLHELGLMNGTVLRLLDEISGEDGRDDAALLLAAEEAIFRLPLDQAERLRLAYACSVHRGQGIELPVAVIVAHPAGGAFFLRREMLYTAITRARLATVIVGTREVVSRAAAQPDTARRHSRVTERLAEAQRPRPRATSGEGVNPEGAISPSPG
jgi:exodeoxyribonuclease V alpha subunit